MKKLKHKTIWGVCVTATLFLATSAHAISVPGTANLFNGGNDFTGSGLPVSSWTPGTDPVLLGSWTPGTSLQVTSSGQVYYSIGSPWGDDGAATADGINPATGAHRAPVWDGKPTINGGAGFYSGTLVGIWSSSNDPLNITPIGGIFKLGTLANLTAQNGYLFAGIADGGSWADNGGLFNVTVTPVPLPASLWLMGSGLLGLLGYRRFQKGGADHGEGAAA